MFLFISHYDFILQIRYCLCETLNPKKNVLETKKVVKPRRLLLAYVMEELIKNTLKLKFGIW